MTKVRYFFGCDGNIHLSPPEDLEAVEFTASELEQKGLLECFSDTGEGARIVRKDDGRWQLLLREPPFIDDPLLEWEHEGYFPSIEALITECTL